MNKYQALKFIPESISKIKVICANCNAHFKPDWLKPRSRQMGSIETSDDSYLQRLSARDRCPICKLDVEIKVPAIDAIMPVMLFGDEASRDLNNSGGRLYTYSLIGTSISQIDRIENKIRNLKRELTPHMDPDEWQIHMTILWSGQQRRKKLEYKDWDRNTIKRLIDGIEEILKVDNDKIFRYNIVISGQPLSLSEKETFRDYVQHEAYILLLMSVIDDITEKGGQPVIHFDSIKPAQSEIVIHEWAKNAFENGSSNLLYSFISHSILVPEPIFVPPASRPFLELADVMSFSIAKYNYRKLMNKIPDINPKFLGSVMYMGFNKDGSRLLQEKQTGYPW